MGNSVCIITSKLKKRVHVNVGTWPSDHLAPTEDIFGGSELPLSWEPLLIRSQK